MVILSLEDFVAAILPTTNITDERISPQRAPRSHKRAAQLIRHIGPVDMRVLLPQMASLPGASAEGCDSRERCSLVQEVAHASEHHGKAQTVRRGNHIRVAH